MEEVSYKIRLYIFDILRNYENYNQECNYYDKHNYCIDRQVASAADTVDLMQIN